MYEIRKSDQRGVTYQLVLHRGIQIAIKRRHIMFVCVRTYEKVTRRIIKHREYVERETGEYELGISRKNPKLCIVLGSTAFLKMSAYETEWSDLLRILRLFFHRFLTPT